MDGVDIVSKSNSSSLSENLVDLFGIAFKEDLHCCTKKVLCRYADALVIQFIECIFHICVNKYLNTLFVSFCLLARYLAFFLFVTKFLGDSEESPQLCRICRLFD